MLLRRGIKSGIAGQFGVVDVLVEMNRRHRRAGDNRNPRLREVALHRMTGENSRPFKAVLVS